MESNVVEPVCHAPASFTDDNTTHSNDNLLNSCNVEGEKSNKLIVDHKIYLAEDEIPRVGMRFEHLKLAQDFYASYAKKVSFVSKIRNTNFDRMTKGPINQSIYCNREGFRGSRVKALTWKNTIAVMGCKARIYAKFVTEKQNWVLLKVDLRHSHPCSTKKAVHYHENSELTKHAKCVIEINDGQTFDPTRHFYHWLMRLETNLNFFYAVNVDDDYKFRSEVWVDARCKASSEYYGDLVSFDTTYNTNRHRLPFASFVGVNHHGKSTLLGCALLGSKEIPSFEWVFTQWLKCMGTAPQGIIIDQCRSIFGAIRKEFVNGDDEADMLHAALNDAHTSIATETSSMVGTEDIQGPSKDNRVESCRNVDLDAPAR
ncbi:protein FAR1-RELATED SEQUENCE 6-like [Arachis ipaensis]|uniref:protein FAR1-RELATED SEQUENCE 6-like n=1 Tax=Arachis ipaensis TaxID=130454 RepID=UPI0007AF2E12|nr:protein FAR1-RELATED SEQUENCE 6-like [Arachis ipaensis]XP_025684794.1 protein FAR1-RELATED SEQUENCE 6-like [Arachis hypogaea]